MKNTTNNITEVKQAAINELTRQVLDAKYEVEQYQSIVNSLEEKASKFQLFLVSSEESMKQTQNNLTLIEEILVAAKDLESRSNIALGEIHTANNRMDKMVSPLNDVVNELIYIAQVVSMLHTLIVRKKASNPLISDEVINKIITSEKDANNAVSLALVALESSFTAQSRIIESKGIATLEYKESVSLVSNIKAISSSSDEKILSETLIYNQLQKAYKNAKENNEKAIKASQITIKQLAEAVSKFNKAEAKLNSFQSGLSAANAAALGS